MRKKTWTGRLCAGRFPQGIPKAIWSGEVAHIEPYPGDNGIRYEEDLIENDEADEEEFELPGHLDEIAGLVEKALRKKVELPKNESQAEAVESEKTIRKMLEPLLEFVEKAGSLEEIGEKIRELYPGLDAAEFQDLLDQANACGRIDGHSRKKRKTDLTSGICKVHTQCH